MYPHWCSLISILFLLGFAASASFGVKFWLIHYYLPIRKIWKTDFVLKKISTFLPFWTLNEKSGSSRSFQAVVSNLHFTWPWGLSWKSCFFRRGADFGRSFDIEWKISGLVAYLFGLVVKSAFYGLMGMFWRDSIFSIEIF